MGLIPLESANIYKNITVQTKYELRKLVSDYNSRLFDAMSLFLSDNPNISGTFFNTHRIFKKIENSKGVSSRIDCRGGKDCKE